MNWSRSCTFRQGFCGWPLFLGGQKREGNVAPGYLYNDLPLGRCSSLLKNWNKMLKKHRHRRFGTLASPSATKAHKANRVQISCHRPESETEKRHEKAIFSDHSPRVFGIFLNGISLQISQQTGSLQKEALYNKHQQTDQTVLVQILSHGGRFRTRVLFLGPEEIERVVEGSSNDQPANFQRQPSSCRSFAEQINEHAGLVSA